MIVLHIGALVLASLGLVFLACVVWELIDPAGDEYVLALRGIALCCAIGLALPFIGGFV